ncbi:MAG: VPDSG-CTERM sorting domain-containing protein [Verrucomicrobiae bacterium]|nr:VPDSG-CTERM sorting domain-containing protein [Verrucomicrobiae bacterium]
MTSKLTILAAVAVVAMAFTQTTQAVPVTGNVGFSGAVQLNSSSVQTATGAGAWFDTVVNATSGSFTTVANGSAVTLATPWAFNSGAIGSFWSVGGFTFDLTSSAIYSQDALFLNVVLNGTVSGNGYDATAFSGTFQVANPAANGLTTFTERLSFNSVPDGGSTMLLLGGALTGLGLLRRKLLA